MDSSTSNLLDDFFNPVLKEAISYDRGVGFFTSGWLTATAKGIIPLIENGGKIRFITSPILDERDYESMRLGDKAKIDQVIYSALERNIAQLETDLAEDVRNALSWLVADGLLEFKFAVPTKKLEGGDFHVKFGIFRDSTANRIAFTGSYNDSAHANLNFEELTIFKSFDSTSIPVIEQKERLFERLWQGVDPNIDIYSITETIRNKILRLRDAPTRPYNCPQYTQQKLKPTAPVGIKPFDHQREAIDAWEKAGRKGILEMATGTGKTKTSFFAIIELLESTSNLLTVIACPQKSLAVQWTKECQEFNMKYILASSDNNKWKDELADILSKTNLGMEKYYAVVCTHETIKSESFHKTFSRLNKNKVKSLLVADECHHLGAIEAREKAFSDFDYKLGLSATPSRLYDKEGSAFVESYLGQIIYKFPLKKAIETGILCGYEYYAHPVYLTDEEAEEYLKISLKISRLFASSNSQENLENIFKKDTSFQNLIYMRANVLKKASMKLEKLRELLSGRRGSIQHAVVFCAPDTDELEKAAQLLSEQHIAAHRFTGSESTEERESILKEFNCGNYQVITAMNIFNEGIDVPNAREAFFLSSSSNPAEFVQRRGRVLRKPKTSQKDKAILHDFIVLPPVNEISKITRFEKQMIRKELQRFYIFAEDAVNSISQISNIDAIIKRYFQIEFA